MLAATISVGGLGFGDGRGSCLAFSFATRFEPFLVASLMSFSIPFLTALFPDSDYISGFLASVPFSEDH